MLKEVVDARGPPCRQAGADNFRCQYGEDHKPRQNGDVSLEEKSRDRIAPWKSHGLAFILVRKLSPIASRYLRRQPTVALVIRLPVGTLAWRRGG